MTARVSNEEKKRLKEYGKKVGIKGVNKIIAHLLDRQDGQGAPVDRGSEGSDSGSEPEREPKVEQ
jgi:hypothetical protein